MAGLKNNYQFEFTDTLTTSGTSVRISNEKENGAVATFTNQYITVRSEDNSIVERMKGSAAAGVLTLTMRGLDQSDTDTQDAGLKKERREGSKAFVTYVASQHVDPRDDNTFSGTQTFNNVVVSQDVTIGDDLTVSGDTTLNGKYKGPVVNDITARDVLYPTPVDGNIVQVKSLNSIQFYQTSLGGRQTLGVGTPPADATDVVKGIQRNATNAEALAGTLTNATMTPDDTKYVLDRYNFTESLTAGENILSGEGYRRGNTALNTPGDTNTLLPPANNYTTNIAIGYDTTLEKQGQSFTTLGGVISSVTTVNYKTGSPTGNLGCRIRATTSGAILDTSITTVAESSLGSTAGTATTSVFTFTGNVEVIPGTYYIEQFCDRSNSTTNYSNWLGTTLSYAGGTGFSISSTNVWTDITQDHKFSVTLTPYTEVNTKFYKAFNIANRRTIMGMVKDNVVTDATFTGIKKGYVKGFTGLTPGLPVFLQSDGTITHTITNKKVGEAIASDTILLDIPRHTESIVITRDLSLASGVVTYNHTLGEIPTFVTANSVWTNSGAGSLSTGMGTYNGSTQLCNVAIHNSGILSSANLITVGVTTAAYQTGFIQNITNNTFDINWTKASTPTGTASIFLTLSL